MRLRSYIIGICTLVMVALLGFFYLQADRLLGRRFEDLETLHAKSVAEFAGTVVRARQYLLQTYLQRMGQDAGLAKLYLMHDEKKSAATLREWAARLRKEERLDLVDIVHPITGRSLYARELEDVHEIRAAGRTGSSGSVAIGGQKALMLVAYAPLRLYRDAVGVLVVGYSLNDAIANEVHRSTNTRVRFIGAAERAEGAESLGVSDLRLTIESKPIQGQNRQTRGSVLLVGAASLILIVILLYFFLRIGFLKSFRVVVDDINQGAEELDRGIIRESTVKRSPIAEIEEISRAVTKYSVNLKAFQKRAELRTRAEMLGEITAQVAHDLNGVIRSLEMKLDLDSVEEFSDAKKQFIRSLLERMRGITTSVTEKIRTKRAKEAGSGTEMLLSQEKYSAEVVSTLLEQYFDEKRVQYVGHPGLSFKIEIGSPPTDLVSRIQANEFGRVVSNLVDNAVQAMPKGGMVTATLWSEDDAIKLVVADSGKGIPAEIIPLLGEAGASFGKTQGSGLGLSHAKRAVESWGGQLAIYSTVGHGTDVEITLLKKKATLPARTRRR